MIFTSMGNEWRDIKNYESIYQVSSLGEIRSLDTKIKRGNHFMRKRGRILSPGKDSKGYPQITLYKNGIAKTYNVHRLVAIAFKENPDSLPEVNHIDGVKSNNNSTNLEWCTTSENMKHAHSIGLACNVGADHPRSKITEDHVHEIFKLSREGYTQIEIADKMPIGRLMIGKILNRTRWSHVKIEE